MAKKKVADGVKAIVVETPAIEEVLMDVPIVPANNTDAAPAWSDCEVNADGRTVAPPGWFFAIQVQVEPVSKEDDGWRYNPLWGTVNVEGWLKGKCRVELKEFPAMTLREANVQYSQLVRNQNAADVRNSRGVGV